MPNVNPTAATSADNVLVTPQGDFAGNTAAEALSLVEHKTRGIVPSSKYTTLEEAAGAAVGKTLYLNSNLAVTSAVDLADIPVVWVQGGRFTQGGGGSINFGSFDAGNFQVFYGFTAGITGEFEAINPAWFGTTDLNTLVALVGSNECEILVNKTLNLSAPLTVPVTCYLDITRRGYINQGVHALTINSPFDRKRVRAFMGTGAVKFGVGAVREVFPEWFSATGGVKEAWEAAADNSRVSLNRKEYVETLGITNTIRGASIEGYVGERNNSEIKGSVVKYTGSGAWFTNGSDNGHDWDLAEYDGPQTLSFSNFSLKYGGSVTALTNGAGFYGAGTYGIRDWRGGSFSMKGMHFENWDYPFHGVQSDINDLDATILYCEHGFYLGPRSDQLKLQKLYALYCTQALILDGCVAWVDNLILKECGHENKCPIEIRQISTGNRRCTFNNVWVEDYSGGTASYVNAFFDVGINAGDNGAATNFVDVVINEITYLDHVSPPKTKYLAQVGKGVVRLRNPKGDFSNIDALIDFTGGYNNTLAGGHVEGPSFLLSKCFTNTGGGTPEMSCLLDGPGGLIFASTSNKQFYRRLTTTGAVDTAKSYAISMAVDGQLVFELVDDVTDNKMVLYVGTRHYRGLVSNPGNTPTGPFGPFTLLQGDSYTVANATAGQPYEYVCTVSGTYGDYAALENRTATTTTGGSATTVTLSAATTKLKKGQYIRIAGAGAASGNHDTTIVSVAADGLSIVIADAALTAGSGLAISFRAPTTRTMSLS